MDSFRPPRPRSLRPWYLVAAMLLTWLMGVRGFMAGCGTAMYLRGGTAPDVTAVAQQARDHADPFQFAIVLDAAKARALSLHRDVAFPLSIGQAILGALLVVASGLALGGRPGTRGFVLQVLVANLAFATVEYTLTRGVRAAWIDMVAQAGALLPPGTPEREGIMNPSVWWTFERVRFVLFELGILGAATLAMTRERTKLYFQAVARAVDPSDEP
ncbi:hypothetical protein [Sorangium sp. So ce131]|uniref:hypothetical protein n=1 Tax=Sorangium sp. So ce131 TaxID=3133282 RepID=UPI003F6317D5